MFAFSAFIFLEKTKTLSVSAWAPFVASVSPTLDRAASPHPLFAFLSRLMSPSLDTGTALVAHTLKAKGRPAGLLSLGAGSRNIVLQLDVTAGAATGAGMSWVLVTHLPVSLGLCQPGRCCQQSATRSWSSRCRRCTSSCRMFVRAEWLRTPGVLAQHHSGMWRRSRAGAAGRGAGQEASRAVAVARRLLC